MNDDLREALNDTAGDLAQLIPNPQDWSNWIIYFLEELEDKTDDRAGFFEMLFGLVNVALIVGHVAKPF